MSSITNADGSKPTAKQESEVRKGIQKIRLQMKEEGKVREALKDLEEENKVATDKLSAEILKLKEKLELEQNEKTEQEDKVKTEV